MKLCNIFTVHGEYAVKYLIATSWHSVKRWMVENDHVGYPWTDFSLPYEVMVGGQVTTEWYDALDYCITEGQQIMAEVGDEPIEIGGYVE